MSGQIFRYCKEHQPAGVSSKCGYPGGCDNVATHVPPRLLLRGPVATSEVAKTARILRVRQPTRCEVHAGRVFIRWKNIESDEANGESDVVEGSNRTCDNDGGNADAGGVTTEARSGDGASSSSSNSNTPTEATVTVHTPDDVGSAVTASFNGKGETAVDASVARSFEIGAYHKLEKDVSGGDGGAGFPLTDVDRFLRVRQPTRWSKHAGVGRFNIYGEDNGVVGLEEYNRRTRAIARQGPVSDKGANSDGDAPASAEGGAASSLAGPRQDVPRKEKTETEGGGLKETTVSDKGWRKTISSCEHTDAPHYGKGFCRPCYMRAYNKAKRSGGLILRLPAPPRVEAGSRSPGSDVDRGSRSKGEGTEVVTVGVKAGASADGVKAVTSTVRRKVEASAAGSKAGTSGTGITGTPVAQSRTGTPTAGGKIATSATRGRMGGASIHRLNTAVPKTTALPPPLCGVCEQTVKPWSHVLICDGCGTSFHLGCQGLSDQPFGEWFCSSCIKILLDSDSDSDIENEAKSYLPDTGRSSSTIPSPPSPLRNAAVRNLTNPATTRAYTRSVAAATSSDGQTVTGGISKGGAGGTAASAGVSDVSGKGWQTPRPVSKATVAESGVQPSAKFDGHCGRGLSSATVGSRKWTLKGDVRHCRCPSCVSILLQSGGTRPPAATELIVTRKRGASASVGSPSMATTAAAKARRQVSPIPSSPHADSGSEKMSTGAIAPGTDWASGSRGTLHRRVVIRASSQSSLSTGSPTTDASSTSTSSLIESPVNALSGDPPKGLRGKGHRADGDSGNSSKDGGGSQRRRAKKRVAKSIRRDVPPASMATGDTGARRPGAVISRKMSESRKGVLTNCGASASVGSPSMATTAAAKALRQESPIPSSPHADSGSENMSTGAIAPGTDWASGSRGTLHRRVVIRASSQSSLSTGSPTTDASSTSTSSLIESPVNALSGDSPKGLRGKGHRADGDSGNSSKDGGGGQRRRAKKRVAKSIRRDVPPASTATGDTGTRRPMMSESRKGVSTCGHPNRPVYSKGLCKPCYMVVNSKRRQAILGIKPQSMEIELEEAVPAVKCSRVGVRDSPSSPDAEGSVKKHSRSSSGDVVVSSYNDEASTVPTVTKKTKVTKI